MITYAIGDIHGRDDLLERLFERIEADRSWKHPDAKATLIHLGDYVDRGARSREVIDRLMRGRPGFENIYLKGNHEDMMLECLETDDRDIWLRWTLNGGDATLKSFGLQYEMRGCDPALLAEVLGAVRIEWLKALKLYHLAPPYLFVHAGIVPGVPIEKQKDHDLLWIRNAFLNSRADHGVIVVHGHTPTKGPDLQPNRIGVDTGAVIHGELTAVVLGEEDGPRFLSVQGEPGSGA